MEFAKFNKIPRLSRGCMITEKIDGTNAQICFDEDANIFVGSRNRWITPEQDNYGFAKWAYENQSNLFECLGPGRHYGEWWGSGIQRRYDKDVKTFSLFNVTRWEGEPLCEGVSVVPILYKGLFTDQAVEDALSLLATEGSVASPGFKDPEGIVVYHISSKQRFKKTIKNDEQPKGV